MATLVLGLAGAALGSSILGAGAIGGLGITGTQLGFFVGSSLGGLIGGGDTIKQEGARLSDLKVQTSTYGNMIPIYYGKERGTGNVIWSTDLIETATKTKSESGGKGGGGGSSVETTTYTYKASFAVSLADSYLRKPLGVLRVWANNLLILDLRPESVSMKNFDGNYRVYLGDEEQEPSSLQEAHLGVGNVPAYRGQLVIEFEDMQLAKFGNRIPNISCEIVFDSDTVLERPLNTEYGAPTQIKISTGGVKSGKNFALRTTDPTYPYESVDIGYYDLETNQFVSINNHVGFDEAAFVFSYNSVFLRNIDYFNPLTQTYEKHPLNKAFQGTPTNAVHIFNASAYTYDGYIKTPYLGLSARPFTFYPSDENIEPVEVSESNGVYFMFQNTWGYPMYDEILQRVLIFKQNPAFSGCFLIFIQPIDIYLDPLTMKIVKREMYSQKVTLISNVLSDDNKAQPYLNQDLLIGYRAVSNVGTSPITVAKITQDGVYSVFFTSTIKCKINTTCTCFYDDIRNRLVFISADADYRLLVTYYEITRTRVAIANTMSNLQRVFDNVYTYSSTPVEIYVKDENGDFVTGISPEANLGGLTKDEARYFFSKFELGKGGTVVLDANTLKVLSISEGAETGISHRGGTFVPNYTEPAFYYKNTVLTNSSSYGLTRVYYNPNTGSGVSLASIVQNISEKVGMGEKVDVTELTNDYVYGYKISQVMPARSAIETLQRAFQFDSVESSS